MLKNLLRERERERETDRINIPTQIQNKFLQLRDIAKKLEAFTKLTPKGSLFQTRNIYKKMAYLHTMILKRYKIHCRKLKMIHLVTVNYLQVV